MLLCFIFYVFVLVLKALLCIVLHTFTLHDVSGAIKVSGCVSRAGNAVVLSKLSLIFAHRAADAAVCASVVVMSWRALDCRSQAQLYVVRLLIFTVGLNAYTSIHYLVTAAHS